MLDETLIQRLRLVRQPDERQRRIDDSNVKFQDATFVASLGSLKYPPIPAKNFLYEPAQRRAWKIIPQPVSRSRSRYLSLITCFVFFIRR